MKAKTIEIKAVFIQKICQFQVVGNIFPIDPKPPTEEAPFLVNKNLV
jgi:hypothetical protein